jgi:hypothetical protein
MKCLKCRLLDRSAGLLCAQCSEAIAAPIVPQQIISVVPNNTEFALVDQWGRSHSIGAVAEIGRTVVSNGLSIFDASVSRHHAWIRRTDGRWILRDAGSSNGTLLNQVAVMESALMQGDRVDFGRVAFYAAFDVGLVASSPAPPIPVVITCIGPTTAAPLGPSLRILEPTGGNGGIVELANTSAQLTAAQLELVDLLSRRMREDVHLPLPVRGFVRSSELVGALSWDAHAPNETHVKQLVRRIRRTFVRSGLGDLIESRHRLGYRLRVTPSVA